MKTTVLSDDSNHYSDEEFHSFIHFWLKLQKFIFSQFQELEV